jgi:protein involved in polysaccharide export with SLBB domain
MAGTNKSRLMSGVTLLVFAILCSESLNGQEKSSNEQFRIGSSDVLQISIYQHPELSRKAVVNEDGNISLPPLDEVKVAGLTVQAAADLLRSKLQPILSAPQVTLTVTEIHHGVVHRLPFLPLHSGPAIRDVPAPDHPDSHATSPAA